MASLQKREMLAIINGDRDTMVIMRLLWMREYSRCIPFSGGAKQGGALAMESLAKYAESAIPGWLKRERARPLRLVIERTEYRVQIGYGPGSKCWKEKLICGHELNLPVLMDMGKPPKRRRCGQCGKEAEDGNTNFLGMGARVAGGVGA